MICGLRGKIESLGLGIVSVDVGGVFYKVFIPRRLTSKFELGEQKEIKTYMHLAEGVVALYGFESREEVDLFEMLLGVSGVGPKSGLMIFDENGIEEIKEAIINADVEFFKKIKGLGLKTAQKIIIDLKSKLGSVRDLDLNESKTNLERDEVYMSLIQLGFDKKIAGEIVKKVPKEMDTTEKRLGWCLKNM